MDDPLALSLPSANILELMCRTGEGRSHGLPCTNDYRAQYQALSVTKLLAEEEAKLARLLAKRDGER